MPLPELKKGQRITFQVTGYGTIVKVNEDGSVEVDVADAPNPRWQNIHPDEIITVKEG